MKLSEFGIKILLCVLSFVITAAVWVQVIHFVDWLFPAK